MTGGLAPGHRAHRLVAAPGARSGGRGGRIGRLRGRPARLRIPAWVFYPKDEVFGLCDTLAGAERALIFLGARDEASRVAAVFEVLESGLARQARARVSRGTARSRSPGS